MLSNVVIWRGKKWGLCLGLAAPLCVWAQASTLHQAVDVAWQRAPQAVALSARQDQVQAGVAQARGLTPAAGAVSLSQLGDQLNQAQGRREWELEWSTPLWLPGQQAAREREATLQGQALHARTELARWQLAGEVRQAWWAVAEARAQLNLAQQRHDTARALDESVQRRFKVGELARVDANLARSEVLSAQGEVLAAQQAWQASQQAYLNLVGELPPADLPAEAACGAQADEDSAAHPQWLAWQAEVDAAQSRLAVLDASRRASPELALRLTHERSDATQPYAQAVGIKVTLPLSSAAQVGSEGAQARADLAQAEAEQALARMRVRQAVQQARLTVTLAAQQLGLAHDRLALSDDNLRLASKAFELGEADLPSVLRARAAAHEAQSQVQQLQVAHLAAQSRCLQAQGVMP